MVRSRSLGRIDIPVAPMLDMAFNLLTFFIFTYKPAPVEVQFNLNLLPAAPAATPDAAPASTESVESDTPAPLDSLTTTLYANDAGGLDRIGLEEFEFGTFEEFAERLETILGQDLGFEQALIQVDPHLKYEYLIEVIALYQRLELTKISFTELPAGG